MSKATIFIIDDDSAMQDSLNWLLKTVGYQVRAFLSAQEFLDAFTPEMRGCMILDIRLPGMSGLQLQQKMSADGIHLPVIIISGHSDIPMAVKAMQQGAMTFLEKPFRDQELLDSIQNALEQDGKNEKVKKLHKEIKQRLDTLTPRENEILERIVAGDSSRVIGEHFGISVKTVEVHRAHIMEKMQTKNLPKLVHMILSLKTETPFSESELKV